MADRAIVRHLAFLVAVHAKAHRESPIGNGHGFRAGGHVTGLAGQAAGAHVTLVIVINKGWQLIEPHPGNRLMRGFILGDLFHFRAARLNGTMAGHAQVGRGQSSVSRGERQLVAIGTLHFHVDVEFVIKRDRLLRDGRGEAEADNEQHRYRRAKCAGGRWRRCVWATATVLLPR